MLSSAMSDGLFEDRKMYFQTNRAVGCGLNV